MSPSSRFGSRAKLRRSSHRGTLRLVALLISVAGVAVAAVALYNAFGRPEPRTEIVVAPAAAAVSQATGSPASAEPAPPASPVADPPFSLDLLRPGVELISRFDANLAGSGARLVAVSSRYTATTGCQQQYVELYGLREHRWQRLYDAADPGATGGALLPVPAELGGQCFPELRLFAVESAGDKDLIAIAAGYADGSVRLQLLGWDVETGVPSAIYDRRSGANGRVAPIASERRIELSEDLPEPDGASGAIGRLSEIVAVRDGRVDVSRRIAPNCDRGRMSAGGAEAGALQSTERRLLLDCSNGSHVVAGFAGGGLLSPSGVAWENLRDGDSLQVEYDAASLQPESAAGALPLVVNITDYAANTRRLTAARGARQAATAPRPAGPAAPPYRSAPADKPPAPSGPAQSSQGSAGGSAGATTRPAATRAPRSSGPAGPPVPAVTPPPAPRNPPFAGPPPAPPAP